MRPAPKLVLAIALAGVAQVALAGAAPGQQSAAPPATPLPAPAEVTAAQQPAGVVDYDVTFPEAVHHTARIRVTFSGLVRGRPLDVLMARSSTGRYALHEFAKNVYDVLATDARGRLLAIVHPAPSEWQVSGHDGTVRVSYTVFGDHADGTYLGIDSTHAHFNMPAAFMFARGLERRPIHITFHLINGWEVATQLLPVCEPPALTVCRPGEFTAPHLDYFFDSPTELSRHELFVWKVAGPGGKATLRAAIHHEGMYADAKRFSDMLQRVVAEEAQVFGELPLFDGGTYTFILDFLPWVYPDGMEHRNSTLITGQAPLAGDGALRDLGAATHEFFHAWNMKRLRDRAIEPFNFERANSSPNLWFGEGFTSYYTTLIRARAGFLPLEGAAAEWGSVVDATVNSPARRYRSAVGMSEYAPFADAAVSVDLVDYPNVFLSYYTWGDALGLALDLTLRERFQLTLDDYMRRLWEEFGRLQVNDTPRRTYTTGDLRRALGELTASQAFADGFFEHYIDGHDAPDYRALLAPAGVLLRPAHPDAPVLGPVRLEFGPDGAVVDGPTLIGTPLYRAGADNRDVLVSLDGKPVTSDSALSSILAAHKPGDHVPLTFVQRGQTKTTALVLAADPTLEIVTFEQAGMPVTPAIRAFRDAWLGTRVKETPPEGGTR